MRECPALDVDGGPADMILAVADDFEPTAFEERGETSRLYFSSVDARDRAATALRAARYVVSAIDVDDEDWARRSQDGLPAVTVGGITILSNPKSQIPDPKSQIVIVIVPSMGFGTGHHATTRLCLAALQRIDLKNRVVLDVGTGSGILALAAARLGAGRAMGLDHDPDAIQASRENLLINPHAARVEFRVADLGSAPLPPADVITANLTATLLVRSAGTLVNALVPGGVLIVSGLLIEEQSAVRAAFSGLKWVSDGQEDEWAALVLQR